MATHGKDSSFKLEDSAGTTLRDLSANLTNIGWSRKNETHQTTAFGAEGHTYIAGLTDGKITITGWTDYTATTGTMTVVDSLVGLDAITVGFEYGPHGTTTGFAKYTGECVLESVDVSDPVADLVSLVAVLPITGDVVKGVL